ncbi:hypothetical protein BKA70DRAFT_551019 [Coprinopsis sp. MPI-PUGE-AT-0042]|nr:hypothetical protein BKA70DRAFT_551019 [Coprinopsis sp. MPI-PUGE-AT-0042]
MADHCGNVEMPLSVTDNSPLPISTVHAENNLQDSQASARLAIGNDSLPARGVVNGSVRVSETDQVAAGERGEHHDTAHEPDADAQIACVSKRLVEMGLLREDGTKLGDGNHSPKEAELLDMIISLIHAPRISPSQLADQADIISNLQARHEYLSAQMDEQRERWECERNGWERMGEALVRRRTKPGPAAAAVNQEVERKCLTLEAENRMLKDQLHDMHGRVLLLDSEIMKLKPLLLTLSMASGTRASPVDSPSVPIIAPPGRSKKGKESASTLEEPRFRTVSANLQPAASTPQLRPAFPLEAQPFSYEELLHQYSYSHPSYAYSQIPSYSGLDPSKASNPYIAYNLYHGRAAAHGDYQAAASSTGPLNTSALNSGAGGNLPPSSIARRTRRRTTHLLTADARIDHLLLAARKIGREGAARLASSATQSLYGQGSIANQGGTHSLRQTRARNDSQATPSTEAATGPAYQHLTSGHQPQPCNHDATRNSRKSTLSSFDDGQTQVQRQSAVPSGGPTTPQQHHSQVHAMQTPLDSLVNAALQEERRDQQSAAVVPSRATQGRRRKVAEIEQPEAPSTKRRKSNTSTGVRVHGSLEMLADQAQAAAPISGGRPPTNRKVSEKHTSSSASAGNGKTRASKGKGKAKDSSKDPNADEAREEQRLGIAAEGSSTGLAQEGKPSRSKKNVAPRKGSTSQVPQNLKVVPKRTRPPPRDRTLLPSDALSSGPSSKAKVRGKGNLEAQSASESRFDPSPNMVESTGSRTTTENYEGPRIIQGPLLSSGTVPETRDVLPGAPRTEVEEKILERDARVSGRRDVQHEEQIDKASSPGDNAISLDKPNLLVNLTSVDPLSADYHQQQPLQRNPPPKSSDNMATTAQLASNGQVDAQDDNLVAGPAPHRDVIVGPAATSFAFSQLPSSSTSVEVPSMAIAIPGSIDVNAGQSLVEGEQPLPAASGRGCIANLPDAFEHQEGAVARSSADPAFSLPAVRPYTANDHQEQPTNEDEQITAKFVSRHDSDLDAEAEDDDGSMDADGEDEYQEAGGSWSQIAYSSTNVLTPLGVVPPIDEDVDVDAEGEVEDESEDPPEAIFRPSELVSGTG